MDYPLQKRKKKFIFWQEFQCLDIVPYSIALLMFSGSIYIVLMAIELTKHTR